MKTRALLASALVAVCLLELWIISGQQHELAAMRVMQQQLTAQAASSVATPPATRQIPAVETHGAAPVTATSELLKLRSQVTRLEERRRELASVTAQNASLRTQLATHGTNNTTGTRLPPGYVRLSEAQFAGYGSPAATLQSFLWALRNRDSARLLQALSPEMAQHFLKQQDANEAFEEASHSLVGMGIVESQQISEGFIRAKIQLGMDGLLQSAVFRQTNGEWKIFEEFQDAGP